MSNFNWKQSLVKFIIVFVSIFSLLIIIDLIFGAKTASKFENLQHLSSYAFTFAFLYILFSLISFGKK
jgi:hypothetical protein